MAMSHLFAGLLRRMRSSPVLPARGGANTAGSPRTHLRRPLLEVLEDRLAPAVTANLAGNLLTVNLGATGDVATILGTAPTGSAITVSGTSLAASPFAGVNSITVTHTPATTNQTVTFQTASPNVILAAAGSLNVSGIATTTVDGVINAGTIAGDSPTVNVLAGNGGKIQVAIDLAGAGGTVNVANGTYTESNILVPKALTINGASRAGVVLAPAIADGHNNSSFGGTVSNAFVVQSNNVTVQNLTIDGNANGALAGNHNFRTGVVTDFNAGAQPFSGLTVQNVTIQNAFFSGIEVATERVGGNVNQILNNTITGVTNSFRSGAGIALFGDTVVSGNTIGGAAAGALNDMGIAANIPFSGGPHPLATIQGNTLTNNTTGMNLAALAANSIVGGPAPGNANTISLSGAASGDIGILVSFSAGPVTFQGNQITGSNADSGIQLFDNGGAAATLIVGNTISTAGGTATTAGTGTGIFLFDDQTINGESSNGPVVATIRNNTVNGFVRGIDLDETFATTPEPLTATLDGNTLTNNTTGVRLLQTNAAGTVTATFVNTNTITGGTTGLLVSGAGVVLTGNTLASAAFAGQSSLYIDLENGALAPATVDATAATFETRTGATATTAQNFAVEAKLHHKVDDPTVGFVRILAKNVFVNSSEIIANGVNAAVAGDTVNIQGGTFNEAVNDTKGLNFAITAPDTVTINSLTGGGNSTVTLNGPGSTLVTGDATNTTYAGTITGAGNLVKQGAGAFTLSGNSNYTGTTAVNAGSLVVTGTLAAGAAVAVNNGATLSGTGTLQRTVNVNAGGTLSPGVSGPGVLTVAGVTFQAGSTFAVAFNGPAAGTGYSQLVVTAGPVNLGNATLQLNGAGFSNSSAIVTLIANTGGTAVNSTFNNLPEGAAVNAGNFHGVISYTGNGKNDITLAPSPSNLTFTAGPNGSNFVVRRSGNNLQVLVDGVLTDSRPLSSVNSLTFIGTNNFHNSLTVDFGFGGYFTLPGPITFHGGTGGTDPLSVIGGVLQTTTVAYNNPGAGGLGLFNNVPGSLQVNFTNTTSLDLSANTNGTVTFQLPASPEQVTITDNGDAGSSTLTDTTGNVVATTYKDATGLVLVTGGPGDDKLTLKRTAATKGDYVLDAGGGRNAITVDLSSETAADVVYMTSTAIHSNGLGAGTIYYRTTGGNLGGAATLSLGSGGNRVFVQGTATGAPTLVQTGAGNDTIIVSSDPDPRLGQLNTFASPLTVDGGAGSNLLIVSEAAKATDDQLWVTDHGLAFDGEGLVVFYRATGGNFSQGVQVDAGSGNDVAIVQSQLAGTPTSVFGDGGDDTFRVAVTSASEYANLLLDGGDGNDTLQVFDQSGGASAQRRLTTFGQGVITLTYAAGKTSLIGFQNMEQQFADVLLTDA